ncbi:hypothetical protein MPK66_gp003 [Erwinia phage pEa_SNUABM_2]|uniref:Uncharacterized protein n=1 Tax=Erwinia phage pEa_SNUABM_2 TaxID=2869547 RepID=A0AAE8C1E7_9CAUD|nr:hypothetical protein MPK66_gp003 [Erwinia phage pEa_SNUABM_2]QZE59247.1 hypothetical protein pEaSNUABM2_00003 [Erwinia phage pEa_SNUABM_2]
MTMQISSYSAVSNFEGPYGLVESDQMIPRWSYPVKHGQVRRVEAWELDTLPNATQQVRMVNDIHAIHNTPVEDYDDALDLDEEAATISKTESRLLIKPRLDEVRARKNKDHLSPENVFSVTDEVIDGALDSIDAYSETFRDYLMHHVFSPILGFDIAAGEVEAIAKDCLKTDLEIDSELVPYIERVGLANVLGVMLSKSNSVPESVRADVLKDWLIKAFDDVRAEHKLKGNSLREQIRRLMHGNNDLVAKGPGIGTTRGFSDYRKQMTENGQA